MYPGPLIPTFFEEIKVLYKYNIAFKNPFVDRGWCPTQSHSHSFPKEHTEAYINYKQVGLLPQASY